MSDCQIPENFNKKPFFPALFSVKPNSVSAEIIGNHYFYFDMSILEGNSAAFPWEDQNRSFGILIKAWASLEDGLEELFHNRNHKAAEIPMIEGLAAFVEALFWSHGEPVPSLDHTILLKAADGLSHKPINIAERLEYILNKPAHYLSFIQLRELFAELTKKQAVYQLKRKK